ncbi:molybdopterin-guanine dinucleotide biosynthesis protein B [Chloroflexota bacterium]
MPPIVAIVGRTDSGKTTLMEKLVDDIKKRGYRVATMKHAQEIHFEPGKDSERHLWAGSEATIVVTPDEAVLIKPVKPGIELAEIARLLGEEYDIILAEGFKRTDMPKIEIRYDDKEPLKGIKGLVAVVSDGKVEGDIRRFSMNDTEGLVDLLEKDFIQPQSERLALYINGKGIALKSFPEKIIDNTVLEMISSLKGIGQINSLDMFIRKPSQKE